MKRRLSLILLPLVAATLGAGCTTFTDNDAAARVDDVEIGYDQLAELSVFVAAANGQVVPETDANQARNATSIWVQTVTLQKFFAAEGFILPDELRADNAAQLSTFPDYASLSEASQDLLVDFLSLTQFLPTVDVDGLLVAEAVDSVDIYVDPRIGSFEPGTGVVPLG